MKTMKAKTIYSFILVAVSIITFSGCGKEGPMGPAGASGLDGNANVIASEWITPLSWSGQSGDWFFDVTNSEITADVVEGGVVLAYMSVPGDLYNDYTVRPMPAYALNANWDFLLPNDGHNAYGKIEFTSTMVSKPGTSGYNFRFVVIPASYILKSARLKSSAADLKNMSYHDVCTQFGIKE